MIYEVDIAQFIHRKVVIEVEADSPYNARLAAWEHITNNGELPKAGEETEIETWVSGVGIPKANKENK